MRDPVEKSAAPGPAVRLPDPIARVLLNPVGEDSVPRMWRRIAEGQGRSESSAGTLLGWAATGAALAVILMLTVSALFAHKAGRGEEIARVAAPGALLLRDGRAVVTVDVPRGASPARLWLSDGSRIEVERESRLEPLASSGREFVVKLAGGTAEFDVEPGGPRRWIIEAGFASVEVVGTRFVVTRRVDVVRVRVERGVVLVRGATISDGVIRLEAGDFVEVHAPAIPTTLPKVPESSLTGARTLPNHKMNTSAPVAWRDDASHGKYVDAYAVLGQEGLLLETAQAESAGDLMTLSDVARLSGHPTEAIEPLERLLAAHASDALASVAAVTLGRIQLDLHRRADAAKSFERALALGVPTGLVEDVYARLVEADVTAGNSAGAQAAADQYARRFPAGRRAADIARWLGR